MATSATKARAGGDEDRSTDDGAPSRDIGERIDAAVIDCIAKTEMAAAARELRNQLLVKAHDEAGWSVRDCARRGHLAPTTVNEMLASS